MSVRQSLSQLFSRFGREFDSHAAQAIALVKAQDAPDLSRREPAAVAPVLRLVPEQQEDVPADPAGVVDDPKRWPVDYHAGRSDLKFLRDFLRTFASVDPR